MFDGQILHSSTYKHATDHLGKKVAVVGACTSGTTILPLLFPLELILVYQPMISVPTLWSMMSVSCIGCCPLRRINAPYRRYDGSAEPDLCHVNQRGDASFAM